MNAYSSLAAMKRLEDAGLARADAEAIASAREDAREDLVTKDYFRDRLDAALAKQTIRIGVLVSGIVAVAVSILGVLISIK